MSSIPSLIIHYSSYLTRFKPIPSRADLTKYRHGAIGDFSDSRTDPRKWADRRCGARCCCATTRRPRSDRGRDWWREARRRATPTTRARRWTAPSGTVSPSRCRPSSRCPLPWPAKSSALKCCRPNKQVQVEVSQRNSKLKDQFLLRNDASSNQQISCKQKLLQFQQDSHLGRRDLAVGGNGTAPIAGRRRRLVGAGRLRRFVFGDATLRVGRRPVRIGRRHRFRHALEAVVQLVQRQTRAVVAAKRTLRNGEPK